MTKNLSKGFLAEEKLRCFFLDSKYYAIRGVPFKYQDNDVTDIDLWLYSKSSIFSRSIIIVDCKNKKKPKAMERIFWVKGLQSAMKADKAFVATTDNNSAIKEFAEELGVFILDGQFLRNLEKNLSDVDSRYSDEEFYDLLDSSSLGKLGGDWKGKIKNAKSLLASGLSFNSCNTFLGDAKYFLEQTATLVDSVEVSLRCFLFVCSLLCINVDYILSKVNTDDKESTLKCLEEGFAYGDLGDKGTRKMISVLMEIVKQNAPQSSTSNQIKHNFESRMKSINYAILAQFFSDSKVYTNLFMLAKELEALSMTKDFVSLKSSSVMVKSLTGCLIDFWGFNRSDFL